MYGGWIYANSLVAAAIELAHTPEAVNNGELQNEICRKYGVFIDNMTDDEFQEFEHLIEKFIKE